MIGTGKLRNIVLRLSVFLNTYLIITLRYIGIHVIFFLLKHVLIIELIQHVNYVVIKMFGRSRMFQIIQTKTTVPVVYG